MPHQVSAALPEDADASLGTVSPSAAAAPVSDAADCGDTPPLNPEAAPDSRPSRSASPLADTAHAPKKIINSRHTTIAPMEVSIAMFRLEYPTIAATLYYSASGAANGLVCSPVPHLSLRAKRGNLVGFGDAGLLLVFAAR